MTTKEELQELRQKFDNVGTKIRGLIDDYNLQKLSIERLTDRNNEIEEDLNNLAYEIEQGESREQYDRWIPKDDEAYFFIDSNGEIASTICYDKPFERTPFLIGNCYKTYKQAEQALERLKIRTQLVDIALRLNKGQRITWGTEEEYKFYLQYAFDYCEINQCETRYLKSQDVIYCLDENFKDVAISEIGEERLKKYLKGE